ncbi:MAG: ATP-binding protein [Ignavibacteria bacterium]|nr:ATP-binding protein [Ignavibacteria bacterium]
MKKKEKIEIIREFTSDRKLISELEEILTSIQLKFPFGKDKFHNILVATTEAVINAIQHGNKNDPQKKVTVKIIAENKTIQILVEDEGEGFDPSTLQDPRTPENILKERGRGIFIIKELSDSTSIVTGKSGTVVKMEFKI